MARARFDMTNRRILRDRLPARRAAPFRTSAVAAGWRELVIGEVAVHEVIGARRVRFLCLSACLARDKCGIGVYNGGRFVASKRRGQWYGVRLVLGWEINPGRGRVWSAAV